MKAFFIHLLTWSSRILGGWFLRGVAYGITAGFFVFRPGRVRAGLSLYRALYPEKSPLSRLLCVWRQFTDFTAGYCDRLDLEMGKDIRLTEAGWSGIRRAAEKGTGGILIASHFGNLEIAARLFKKRDVPLLLLMGEQAPRQVARSQRADMQKEGLDIKVSTAGSGPGFDGLEALQFLEKGGFVAISGDLVWADRARTVTVPFLGKKIRLPEAPHFLALVTGVPLFSLFSYRLSRSTYHFSASPPRFVRAGSRDERKKAILESAATYAAEMEKALKTHPHQWHIFEPVLLDPD
jgi:predicted LPLAT superfamily acyltransferase